MRLAAPPDAPRTVLALLLGAVALLGCPTSDGDDDDSAGGGPEPITGIDNEPGGNPLVPDVALYPFPSDFYLVDDPQTATGRRVALADEALPEGLRASTWADADGFSRAPALLAWFDGGLDPASLPAGDDPGAALADDSPVWLLREDSWARVPLLAELDASTEHTAQQALIIRPLVALDADTGYVVVLRDGLRSAAGDAPPPVTDAFRALRDEIPTDCPEVEAQRDDFALVHAALDASGIDPDSVVLAWSFHTRSEAQVTAATLAMHDVAMGWSLDGWTIDSDVWEDDGHNRLVRGRFPAPDFLGADGRVELLDGEPVLQGTREAPFLITIPATAANATRPVIVFGHGFFSSLEEPTWSSLNRGLQAWRMPAITTDFIGFNEADLFATLEIVGGDLNRIGEVVDQQLQSHVHFTLLARLVAEELAAVVTAEDTTPLLDADAVHYMGISNGGTQGLVLMTASPAFTRGALVVPGGGWSHMIQRATQWNTMGALLAQNFPDPLELQVMFSLLQLSFDPVDALSWVDHLIDDRFPGRPPVEVTLHEAVGDCQVANLVTEWVARSAGVGLVTPSPREVWGLDTIEAAPPGGTDEPAALLIYDEGYPPLPDGNVAPLEDNGAHDTLRDLDVYVEHIGRFLEDGTIVQVCDGACDPQ